MTPKVALVKSYSHLAVLTAGEDARGSREDVGAFLNMTGPVDIPRFQSLSVRVALAPLLLFIFCTSAIAQGSGTLKGSVRLASGAPAPGVSVVATNQVTGKWKRTRSGVLWPSAVSI